MPTHPPRPAIRYPGEGEANTAFGLPREFLVTADETEGALSLWIENVPAGGGPPLHQHLREREVFEVLEGRVLFACGDARGEVGAGGIVLIPPATSHSFLNVGDTPARLLVTMTPGGLEGMFREVEQRALKPPDDLAEIAALAERWNLVFTGPPLVA